MRSQGLRLPRVGVGTLPVYGGSYQQVSEQCKASHDNTAEDPVCDLVSLLWHHCRATTRNSAAGRAGRLAVRYCLSLGTVRFESDFDNSGKVSFRCERPCYTFGLNRSDTPRPAFAEGRPMLQSLIARQTTGAELLDGFRIWATQNLFQRFPRRSWTGIDGIVKGCEIHGRRQFGTNHLEIFVDRNAATIMQTTPKIRTEASGIPVHAPPVLKLNPVLNM